MKVSALDEASAHPIEHSRHFQLMLLELIDHARGDVTRVDDPRFQALLETAAEVLLGLKAAFERYDQGAENAWKR